MTRLGWSHISLRWKLLAVVGVPIVGLLATTISFVSLSVSETQAESRAAHADRVRQASQELNTAYQTASSAIWSGAFGLDSADPGAAQRNFDKKADALAALVANDATSLQALQQFRTVSAEQFRVSAVYTAEIARTHRIPAISSQVQRDAGKLAAVPQTFLDTITARAQSDYVHASVAEEGARRTARIVAIIAGSVGAAGGILLLLLALTSIVRRIRKLGDNARRLAVGAELEPFPTSGDEIGLLAHELEDASRLLQERQRAMRSATDEAEHANQAKSQFLSRMSHELRTPLNSILGFGQMLELSELDENNRADVDHILRAGKHLLALIDEILNLSSIEAGAMRFSIEPVNLEEVVREVVDLTRPTATQNEVQVTAAPAHNVWVRADRQRLKQVLFNLVSNGIKFNKRPGTVSITFASQDDQVRIDVLDTGRGMSREHLGKLFAPFERLGAGEAGIEGTGLGLALSKGLAEGMGGTISARSELGMWSVFSLALPITAAPDAEDIETPVSPSPSDRQTVLYIEDNPANLDLVRRVLEKRHVTLIPATSGALGLTLAKQELPAAILLDLHLPDMHGEDVLDHLRSDAATSGIPVIVITADATYKTRGDRVAAHLTKPINVTEFLDVLDTVLSNEAVA